MTKVKICGNMTLADAQAMLEFGADAVGFIVGLEPRSTRRSITAQQAADIISQLPPGTTTVMVTTTRSPADLIGLAKATGASAMQLHGATLPEEIAEIKQQLPHVAVWKVIHMRQDSPLEKAKKYDFFVDALLLDSGNVSGEGGTGKTHDWALSKKIAEEVSVPVILAGGLNPNNVRDAIEAARPSMVDVNSSVTKMDGAKDLEKAKEFIRNAKSM